jgi:hypothetical protein
VFHTKYYEYVRGEWTNQGYMKLDFAGHEAHFVLNDDFTATAYAWYDEMADAFYVHSPEGTVSTRGYGRSDILVTDRPYIATMEYVSSSSGNIFVRTWDEVSSSWQILDGDLREHDGQCLAAGYSTTPCAIRLAADPSGTLYTTWVENLNEATRLVYVKRHDGSAWTRQGGALNDPADGGYGAGGDPLLRIVEGELFAIYKERTGSNHLLFVKHWNGASWESVSSPLNSTPTSDAIEPDATSIGSTLYVSFIENITGTYRITAKRYP